MPGRKGSRSRKRSGGGGRRDRSSSTQSSRGPHSAPDAVFWKPWHQQPVFSRFWQHYAVLMQGAPLTALGHAAAADACGSCCCCRRRGWEGAAAAAPKQPQSQTNVSSSKRPRENLCRKHKQQQKKRPKQQKQPPKHDQRVGSGLNAPPQGYRDSGTGYHDSDAGGYNYPEAGYDDEYDENDAGYYDSDTGYYYDPYDYESASELTSQLNEGMHIGDQGDTVEPSEEFLAFLAESARHREEWKKKKALMNQAGFLPPTDMELDEQGNEKEPKEHPDSIRSREMKELYGAAAPRLHAMETAVQLAFERVATRRHAKLWPNIPINVIFEDAA